MKLILLNLDRSKDRLAAMRKAFPEEKFTRLKGVDGTQYQDKKMWLPQVCQEAASKLIKTGILAENQTAPVLKPGEIGCAQAHGKAWKYILDKGLDAAIVLEDDIAPGPAYNGSFAQSVQDQGGIPEGAEVLFLAHEDGVFNPPKRWDDDGRLLYGGGNHAYVITAQGARNALERQFPMYLPCSEQWYRDAKMYVVKEPIVTMSKHGAQSTMNFLG